MSLIGSLLGLAIFPLKAKRPEPPKEIGNLAVMALAAEVRRLQFAIDFWRESSKALMEENERLRAACEGQPMAQSGYAMQAYAREQEAMNQAFGYCTCVPARSRALGVHPAEPLPP